VAPIFLLGLKVAFLAILYLFVARAIRAVILDVLGPRGRRRRRRPPQRQAAAPQQRPSRRMPRELVVVDADGRRNIPLRDSMTIGRAAHCDVVVNDTYVSNVHARISVRNGSYVVEDLGSTNGTYLNRAKVTAPTSVGPGDEIKVGKVALELRR
jgi:pSer/pThr/pTyr-binding forkhead associated (FHA) protein